MAVIERRSIPINENVQIKPLIIAVVFTTFATVAVALRLFAKHLVQSRFGKDDYMIMICLFFIYSLFVCDVMSVVVGGVGLHTTDVLVMNPDALIFFSKTLVGVQLAWTFSLLFAKLSLLFFYIRIFSIRLFRVAAYSVMGMSLVWAASVVLETFLLCRPFNSNWNPHVKATCGDRRGSYVAAGAMNLVTDLMVLSLPVPMVWKLKIPRRNKVILFIVFGMGVFVCIVSILRLVALLTLSYTDITYTVPDALLWSMLEPCIGCACACIPIMRPLLTSLFPDRLRKNRKTYNYMPERKSGSRSDDNSFPLTTKNTTSANKVSIHGGRDCESNGDVEVVHKAGVEAGKRSEDDKHPAEGINVKKEVRIQHC